MLNLTFIKLYHPFFDYVNMSLEFLGSKSFSLNKLLFLGLIGGRGPPEPGIGGLGGSGG